MAKKKESKQKKMNVRVDFTPMVDMMMLLITFFMLCTSLAKPQAMHLTMPAKDDNMKLRTRISQRPRIPSRSIWQQITSSTTTLWTRRKTSVTPSS